jgi:hypothetical protein
MTSEARSARAFGMDEPIGNLDALNEGLEGVDDTDAE